jgi:hypothetical protein
MVASNPFLHCRASVTRSICRLRQPDAGDTMPRKRDAEHLPLRQPDAGDTMPRKRNAKEAS